MGFNYAQERKKFEQEWTRLRKEYKEAGMNEETIQLLYVFDLETFRSERTYASHTQALPDESTDEERAERSSLLRKFANSSISFDEADFPGRYAWVDTIENQCLVLLLRHLSDEDLELLTFLILEGHTQRELAQKWGCSQKTISIKFNRIKKILKSSRK